MPTLKRTHPPRLLSGALAFLGLAILAFLRPGSLPAQETLHVSTAGSDAAAGTARAPFRTVQKAVNTARSGDTILIHAGTYTQVVRILGSGTASRPITLAAAGDGVVTLQAPLDSRSCASTDPTRDRTIQIYDGTDHWVVRGLRIVGGILVSGTNTADLTGTLMDRDLPGRGLRDPEGAKGTLQRLGSDGADGVQILGNTFLKRGIYAVAARYGRIEDNEVSDIDCGTGGGIWLGRFSDGWTIRGNHVHDVLASVNHHMSEGIRHSGGSNYNVVEDNIVENLAGPGRGITTDVASSWNVIRGNRVSRADQGFSEQLAGWGNQWIGNVAEENRSAGFSILVKGESLARPTDDVPAYLEMRCNQSRDNATDLNVGAVQESHFSDNDFETVSLGENLQTYWRVAGNTWNGDGQPPPRRPGRAALRTWGDVNGDGQIDGSDALMVLQHSSGQGVEGDIRLGDVNADSEVTSIDALILLRFPELPGSGTSRAGRVVSCD